MFFCHNFRQYFFLFNDILIFSTKKASFRQSQMVIRHQIVKFSVGYQYLNEVKQLSQQSITYLG